MLTLAWDERNGGNIGYMLTAHLPRVNTVKDSEMAQLTKHFNLKYRKRFSGSVKFENTCKAGVFL